MAYNIVALPGDGIGPEIMAATRVVLDVVNADVPMSISEHPAGAGYFRETGDPFPSVVREACLDADAVLLAAIGLPDVRRDDGTEVQPQMMMGLRRSLGLFAADRPIKLYSGVTSALRQDRDIDLVVVRENLEGLFTSFGGGWIAGDDAAGDTLVITRSGTERVVRYAFELAIRRAATRGRPPRVTCVDKANVFRSFAFFRRVFLDVAQGFPEVQADTMLVDAMSLHLVQHPWDFDVLVMENLLGDILSDLAAGLVGGLGMAPSAELGDDHGMFQPAHGSAPDIAGKGIANPLAMILSAAMMLAWLGERKVDNAAVEAAVSIEAAVEQVLENGAVLPVDLGGTADTGQVGQAVAEAYRNLAGK